MKNYSVLGHYENETPQKGLLNFFLQLKKKFTMLLGAINTISSKFFSKKSIRKSRTEAILAAPSLVLSKTKVVALRAWFKHFT